MAGRKLHTADPLAWQNRAVLAEAGVFAVSLFGGPGCGKSSMVAATVQRLSPGVRVGVVTCGSKSDRHGGVAGRPKQVVEVRLGDARRLEAKDVRDALRSLDLTDLDLLLIENFGTICFAALPDLGQNVSATVFSVAAGDDNALKHPHLVRAADVVVLNKVDLVPAVPFDLRVFRRDVARLNPGAELIELSAISGAGFDRWLKRMRPVKAQIVEQLSRRLS